MSAVTITVILLRFIDFVNKETKWAVTKFGYMLEHTQNTVPYVGENL